MAVFVKRQIIANCHLFYVRWNSKIYEFVTKEKISGLDDDQSSLSSSSSLGRRLKAIINRAGYPTALERNQLEDHPLFCRNVSVVGWPKVCCVIRLMASSSATNVDLSIFPTFSLAGYSSRQQGVFSPIDHHKKEREAYLFSIESIAYWYISSIRSFRPIVRSVERVSSLRYSLIFEPFSVNMSARYYSKSRRNDQSIRIIFDVFFEQ